MLVVQTPNFLIIFGQQIRRVCTMTPAFFVKKDHWLLWRGVHALPGCMKRALIALEEPTEKTHRRASFPLVPIKSIEVYQYAGSTFTPLCSPNPGVSRSSEQEYGSLDLVLPD